MADDFASGGHMMSTNMADDLILEDGVALNLPLTYDMQTNDVKKYDG
jgi:hypothetical protein